MFICTMVWTLYRFFIADLCYFAEALHFGLTRVIRCGPVPTLELCRKITLFPILKKISGLEIRIIAKRVLTRLADETYIQSSNKSAEAAELIWTKSVQRFRSVK